MSMRTKALGVGTAGIIGAAAIAAPFISHWEGREYVPYLDVGGVLTVCEGHTGNDIDPNRIYTDQECDRYLARDIQLAARAVDRVIHTQMNDQTKAAFISFTFNVGAENLQRSTLARLANTGDLEGACNQLSRWVFVKRWVIQGLVNRRKTERGLCLEGLEKAKWWDV